jgi:hypothetical protein
MTRKFLVAIVATIMIVVAPWPGTAEEAGWKMPNLNPFSSGSKPPTSGRVSDAPLSGWKMPKVPSLLPQSAARPKRKSNQPTTWNRMTKGTRSFFSKTTDVLTPWDNQKPVTTPNVTGSNTAFTRNHRPKTDSKEQKSGSVLPASWWGSDKGTEPKTVNDFLSQPRPQ